jgi:hypothetical protein
MTDEQRAILQRLYESEPMLTIHRKMMARMVEEIIKERNKPKNKLLSFIQNYIF